MGSSVKKQVFSPQDLRVLDDVLRSASVRADSLGLRSETLQAALRRRLFEIARSGIIDPVELEDAALTSLGINQLRK
ncbi:hypothetical protein AUC71_05625 [Methyloceanibacter marginalis]|uniref:Uncharacterized protein n=1 Tax=Methyloceanibacter marginalis TaxID=1774971 RepID=A0A1E3WGG9_9HYPH|nr:hypothetical protein [Methyloceanibacter marginalis]ODS04137.1 hypothetical protein AUC71_05625 [Methyloceanibacter marginalis]